MIENQTNDIALTPEQSAQLASFYTKLTNIQGEVNKASEMLKGSKLELEKTLKEKTYQEQLLAEITPQVEALKIECSNLVDTRTVLTATMTAINGDIATKKSTQEAKEMELKDREDKITSKEAETQKSSDEIADIKKQLEESKIEHEAKVNRLKEVISTL